MRGSVTRRCVGKWDYDAQFDGELSFKEGDTIEIIERVDDVWIHGRLNGRSGMFAATYVELLDG